MKRNKRLEPGKPLARKTRLRQVSAKRAAQMAEEGKPRTGLSSRKAPIRKARLAPASTTDRSYAAPRRKNTGPDQAARDLVKARDRGRCAVCGLPVDFVHGDWSIHHRRNRAMGGTSIRALNLPANLLLVHGSGATLCHGDLTDNRDRAKALAKGWIVPTNSKQLPATVPVQHAVHGRVLLDDSGGWSPAPQAGA